MGSDMTEKAFVIGVGMTKFEKPGARDWDYPEMAKEAGGKALEDAGIPYEKVEQAFVGYCYGESTSGQRAVYGLGLTGIPVVNVNNNCSTGSSALYMARQGVRGGLPDRARALGLAKMEKCSPTSDGSACAVVASERFVEEHDLWDQAIEIAGQAMVTDMPSTFEERSSIKIVGFDMSKEAADKAYAEAEVGPDDVDVVELHDCFSSNELIPYEALGLADVGEGHTLVDSQDTTFGGRWVVNPSGGLISKGHPLGATGLAQCSELTWQLRGQAEKRQVEGAKVALQHNIGLGGAVVVTMYRKGFA